MTSLLGSGTRCLLVHSRFSEFSFWNFTEVCEIAGAKYPATPLGLLTVAALLPQQWEFKLVDENVEPLLDEHFSWADVLLTGGMLPQQQSILRLIDRAHAFGLSVVVGGPDPTSQPHLYRSADFLVLGEGEITIPMLLADLAAGRTRGEYSSAERADMAMGVIPRFDLIRFQDYVQVGVQYSRGCPFNCEFCNITQLYGRKPRTKTVEQVILELQHLYDRGYRGHIDFVDDNFIGDKTSVRRLLTAIRIWSAAHNYPFYFSTEASINLAEDDGLLRMMEEVDFRYVFLGIETPENAVLEGINKRQNIDKSVLDAVKKINAYGMVVNAGFILGLDGETDATATNMISCIEDSGICMSMVGKLCALPNTRLTRRLREEGRLLEEDLQVEVDQTKDGLNFLTHRPRLDILRDYRRVLQHLYEPGNYYDRIMQTAHNLKRSPKHRPTLAAKLRMARSFLRLCRRAGFDRETGPLYWRMLAIVLVSNARAVETAANLAAMYVHFRRQSAFVLQLTDGEIERIESGGETCNARRRA